MADILWVCASSKRANIRRIAFSNPSNVMFIGIGVALCAARFNEIILDDIYAETYDSYTTREWISQRLNDMSCHLLPGGHIRSLCQRYGGKRC